MLKRDLSRRGLCGLLLAVAICAGAPAAALEGQDAVGGPQDPLEDELLPERQELDPEEVLLDPDFEAFDGVDGFDYPNDDPLDWIFYHYGTACFGIDWRFLRAVARAESGLNPRDRTGSYIGLFQWAEPHCNEPQNMGPFKDFLGCDDLTDPEANTLVSAHRFHRMFTGERFIDGELQRDRTWPDPMLEVCWDASVEALTALAYVGHNNGPGVLKHVLRFLGNRRLGCELDQQEAAVRSFYEHSSAARAATAEDVARCNRSKAIQGNARRMLEVGMRHRRCVNANYGADKWRYGIRKIVAAVQNEGIVDLYPPDELDPDSCPIYDGVRVYALAELMEAL